MTNSEKFSYERKAIKQALISAGAKSVLFNKDDVPKELPAAIVILDGETGKNGTSRRFVDTDIAWTVFLVVNAQKADDPDQALYTLKENFRTHYIAGMNRDLPKVEYYTSRIDGARLVRIARIELLKAGTGAGS